MVSGTIAGSTLKAPACSVLRSDNSETVISIEFPEIEIQDVETDGQRFQRIRMNRAGWLTETGKPELPVLARLVAVPAGASVEVSILGCDYSTLKEIRIFPSQGTDTKENVNPAPTIDNAFYGQDIFCPEAIVDTVPSSMLRDCCVVPLIVYPVQYNPHQQELRVFRNITFRLYHDGVAGTYAKRRHSSGGSEAFKPLYRSSILNYSQWATEGTARGGYLIISPDQYEEALGPLVKWKRQKGHHTDMVTLSQIGSYSDFNQIRNYIQNYYEQSVIPLEYVIVVGDVPEMPTYFYPDEMESSGYDAADHPYSMLEGNDYFPDVMVGRLSVSSVNEMRTVVNKIVSYESDPYMGQTDWYKRALMVCNYEGNASSRTTKIWVKEKLLDNGFEQVSTSFTRSASHCDVSFISTVLNMGVSFVNYRGWLDWGGWTSSWTPPVNFDNINRLHNGFMLPIVTDMVCNAADFYGSCPAEAWLRAGSVTIPKGAVAAMGPTAENTKVYFNNVLDAGFYAGVFDDSLSTTGQAFTRAKMELYMQYPLNRGSGHAWNSVECYFYMYTLIGDPGLDMWTDIPQLLTVEHSAAIPVGATYLDISVTDAHNQPIDGAYVCLTEGEEILSGGLTASDGGIQLPVSATANCSITVTVTKHNYKPYQFIIGGEADQMYTALSGQVFDDDPHGDSQGDGDGVVNPGETIELALALQNTSSHETALLVSGSITSTDPYVTIMRQNVMFGDISPGETVWGQSDCLLSVSPDCPDGRVCNVSFEINDRSGSRWSHVLWIPVEAPCYSVQTLEIVDSGGIFPNACLDPGETVQLVVTIANGGQKTGENIQATLWTGDQNITLMEPTAHFSTIDSGGSGSNSEEPFIVTADLDIFSGQPVQFQLYVESNGGMMDTATFSVSVGTAFASDPVGPDAYGYLAYDDGDWSYQGCPSYDWTEIDPAYGGSGAVFNFIDERSRDVPYGDFPQGDSEVLPLPFTFQYYGQSFDDVTVCSNGWLSLGSTWMTSFRNWGIPGVLNPPCLIAPFWDDLYIGSGRVVSYYDEPTHRFIVEWSHVRNSYNAGLETFQVVLIDPEYHSTETGDGEILFHYHSIDNGDFAWNFATVGIESPDKKSGVQYTYAGQYSPGAAALKDGMAIKFTTGRHHIGGPSLSHYGHLIDDDLVGPSIGDGDGQVDAGERIELAVRLINLGHEEAQDIEATLQSADPNVIIEESLQTYPDIAPGDTARSEGPFIIRIAPECENGHTIEFELRTEVSGSFNSFTNFEIGIVAPHIILETFALVEIQGDGDNRPESAETCQLQIVIQNAGEGQATGVWGQLTSNDEYVSIQKDTAAFSDMEPHETASNQVNGFVFSVINEPSYHVASFLLSVFSNDNLYQIAHSFEIIIERAEILLVDDDGGDDIEQWYALAFDEQDWSYERYDRMAVSGLDSVTAEEYRTLIWFTGSARNSTLTPADQEWLSAFLEEGGNLFLSGQNIAADLQSSPFLEDYLHARFEVDRSEDIWMFGVPGDPLTGDLGMLSLASGNYGANNQTSPDEIEVLEGAYPMLTYYSSGRPAALRYVNGYHLVFFAFGFESIIEFHDVANAYAMRAAFLGRILNWFQFEPRIGDVNEDGVVDVLDIIRVINIILDVGAEPTGYQTWASDYTGDGQINVVDVIGIVNTLLSGSILKSGKHGEKNLH